MKIQLFLPDFKSIVKGTLHIEGGYNHNVLFYETSDKIIFYKPLGSLIYFPEIIKDKFPKDKIDDLKSLFSAFEVPAEIMPKQVAVLSGELRY